MELTKSNLAKLLATENITVQQQNVKTASFDVKNRVLTLPMWVDVSKFTEDHLIGHEVGHALYTPLEGWHDAVCERGQTFKSYLNVVEDARIEKLIQRKYPGLRTSFVKSYRTLLADGFFGGDIDKINGMGLIDRINTYFKCGMSAGVEFAADEQQWVDRIAGLESWDDVVTVTEELFAFCKEQAEKEAAQQQELQEQMSDEDGEEEDDTDSFDFDDEDDSWGDEEHEGTDGQFMDSEEESEDGDDEQGESAEGDESDESEESDDTFADRTAGGATDEDHQIRSQTDESLRDTIAKDIFQQVEGEVINVNVMDLTKNYGDFVVGYKRILNEIDNIEPAIPFTDPEEGNWGYSIAQQTEAFKERAIPPQLTFIGNQLFSKWYADNKKTVAHMAKEFEMRKSATEFARVSTAKTGVIDTLKMNNYKLTDDIFKKVSIVPEGKNHAFIMMLDMSGSMHDRMYETLEQTLQLVYFCRAINVPFRVFGFSDVMSHRRNVRNQIDADALSDWTYYPEEGQLFEFFSDKMSKSQTQKMASTMLMSFCDTISQYAKKDKLINSIKMGDDEYGAYYWTRRSNYYRPRLMELGGTPMDAGIMILTPLVRDFRKSTRADVVHTFFLTDGVSHEAKCKNVSGYGLGGYVNRKNHVTINSPYTNQRQIVKYENGVRYVATPFLLNMYREATGASVIGFFIESNSARALRGTLCFLQRSWGGFEIDEQVSAIRREGFGKVNADGYDELYLMTTKSLQIQESKMDQVTAGEVTKAKLRTAFKKSTVGASKSRVMLNDLVARVA